MRRRYFAHGHIRTLIAAFGALFNKTYVANFSKDGKSIDRLTHVPIMYLPRSRINKMDQMFEKQFNKGDLDRYRRYYEVFPRMGFEWKGMDYDAERQLPKSNNYRSGKQFGKVPAPYNLSFELVILAPDQFTIVQIIEQITAPFRPNINIEIKHPTFDDASMDVTVNINGVTTDDSYAEMDNTRVVMATLSFTMKTDFWPYVNGADIEIGKFVECGGEVDYPIDPLWPRDDDDSGDEGALIERIVIDSHELSVFPNFWPTLQRTEAFYNKQGEFVVEGTMNPMAPIPDDQA
ncbi:proximal tail sheath stabilization [Sinorhizobium phage phiM9]|uniref:Proximal tail sheath stabilization n=1 Tax=Sinorhizobium phage phiM9 TaxID=1636182 RepID=A0A0F6R512_9CAUD|nr:proximal tail sheath stabilization [Sinorhizobium phage phiM9]AKE44757.1 proximal tail sheath stabilization [Sinorhizobium phage phiM9]